MIEEVKRILNEVYWEEFDYSQPDWEEQGEKYFADKAQQICQLKTKLKLPKHLFFHSTHVNKTFPCKACACEEYEKALKELNLGFEVDHE